MAVIDSLFKTMCDQGASDLHMTSGQAPMLRLDGRMKALPMKPISEGQMVGILREITPPELWEEFEQSGDADYAYELEGFGRFRTNLFRDLTGPGAVFRLIPSEILTAEQLGFGQAILDLCRLTKGLVLVTGPTGSGKSTTLCAMIDYINRTRQEHVITIEDPVEFVHPNKQCLINQREVGTHTNSFKAALRAALREDPDIILCGELRDLETVEIALEMAETGHLVFGTLHTTTAAGTVDRVVDQFPAGQQAQIRTMLATTLKGVIAQNLLRKKPKGRVAAMEILIVNNAVASYIREGKTHQIPMAMQTGRNLGMVELNTALIDLVRKGVVEAEEAYTKAVDKSSLARMYQRFGVPYVPPGHEPKAGQPDADASMSAEERKKTQLSVQAFKPGQTGAHQRPQRTGTQEQPKPAGRKWFS
jgi:twitching motility protein PilT